MNWDVVMRISAVVCYVFAICGAGALAGAANAYTARRSAAFGLTFLVAAILLTGAVA